MDRPSAFRDGLAGLLAPCSLDTFFSQYWEKAPLHVTGSADFTGLISAARIDALVSSQVFHGETLSMARSEPRLGPEAYLGESGQADRGLVVRAYQQGATLILPQLDRREAPLAELCRVLEAELGHPLQTNIYLTPPTAQGFQTHYDTHDVFILQVEGAKRWRLYDAPAGTVFRGEKFQPGQVDAGDVTAEFVLTPGDVLYVPRGLMHDAVNEGEGEASLHITAGVLARTWADFLLEAVSEVAIKSPQLRATLPAHITSPNPNMAELRSVFDEALDGLKRDADLEAVAGLFADQFTSTRPPQTQGGLLSSVENAIIRRRDLTPMYLVEDGDHVALVAPGGPVSFDPPAEPALEKFIAGEPVSEADFGALGEYKSRDSIARLLAFGLAVAI